MLNFTLTGECNRCGLCCAPVIDGVRHPCINLVPEGILGEPNSTLCSVYDTRYEGMPIKLVGIDTPAVCRKGSDEEAMAILTNGIGQGCSLEVTRKPWQPGMPMTATEVKRRWEEFWELSVANTTEEPAIREWLTRNIIGDETINPGGDSHGSTRAAVPERSPEA